MLKLKYTILDTITMVKRNMLLSLRSPDALLFTAILPIAMMVLFVYVFGGSMNVGDMDYVNFIIPAVLILSIGQTASMTAIHIKSDVEKGITSRFRSMPISKSSVLTGHVTASVLRNLIASLIVIGAALLMGFRPNAGFAEWMIAAGLLLLYMLTVTWASVFFGLAASSVETAGMFQMVLMLLPYLSSGFALTVTMPAPLRWFSENQPLTPIIEAIRSLFMYSDVGEHLLPAILWCIGLLIVSYAASVHVYKSKAQ